MEPNKEWGEPTDKFFAENDTLLNEINKLAHAAGTNAALRDVLKKSWKAIKRLTAAAEVDPSPTYTQSEMNDANNQIAAATIERCALVAENLHVELSSSRLTLRKEIAAAIRALKDQP